MNINITAALMFKLCLVATVIQASRDNERKPYIVYMGETPRRAKLTSMHNQHHSLLTEVLGDESRARSARIHSYGKSINGFAANLLPHEANILGGKKEVLSVFPNTMRKLATTRSWDFLGMPEKIRRNAKAESNIIVGLLDTGIYVDAPSFSDEGYGPSPSKWKGKCDKGANFTGCNKKVIGAKFYNLGNMDSGMDPSPTDTDGHGSHTASTAAGITVSGGSLYGLAKGTVRGGVPGARIAMYKVCGTLGCSDMNLLAGLDDAIADGVDLLSVSIGGPAQSFFDDVIAIGSFHALKKGILTVCAAGNDGPEAGTVANVAPWILTVAATNLDREFRTKVKLGNGAKLTGTSVNTFTMKKAMYPLTSSDLAYNASSSPFANSSICEVDALTPSKVKGRIVLCMGNSAADWSIVRNNGSGTIIALDEVSDLASTALVPATIVNSNMGRKIAEYINSTKSPQAVIEKSRNVQTKNKAPVIASFSSRGPQTVARNILKPDMSAPGLNILAAYSKLVTIMNEPQDSRYNVFNIISGTSMACPHVSGAAAYVKSFHPDWSAAAIKSALMTTAKPVRGSGFENPLNSGAGLLNPAEAVHPGLIYDIQVKDYIKYLCKEGYNSTTIGTLVGATKPHFNCSKFSQPQGTDGLNYPSMHVQLLIDDTHVSAVFQRTVTHVGFGPAVYRARVEPPKGLSIKVIPDVLTFSQSNEKKSFRLVIKGTVTEDSPDVPAAFLEWSDSKHKVRSPIVIYKPIVWH